jgi:hypothetical protein
MIWSNLNNNNKKKQQQQQQQQQAHEIPRKSNHYVRL